jgi:hypothetical protein
MAFGMPYTRVSTFGFIIMKKPYSIPTSDEPVGIVISRGSRAEPTPVFVSYVWGPVPEPADNASKAA